MKDKMIKPIEKKIEEDKRIDTVYIVSAGIYEDKHIVGVFSTKEIAEDWIRKRKNRVRDFEVGEYKIDSLLRDDNKVVYSVGVSFYENGEVHSSVSWLYALGNYQEEKDFKETTFSIEEKEGDPHSTHYFRGRFREFYGYILAEKQGEAVQFLIEYAQKYNKKHPFKWEN